MPSWRTTLNRLNMVHPFCFLSLWSERASTPLNSLRPSYACGSFASGFLGYPRLASQLCCVMDWCQPLSAVVSRRQPRHCKMHQAKSIGAQQQREGHAASWSTLLQAGRAPISYLGMQPAHYVLE